MSIQQRAKLLAELAAPTFCIANFVMVASGTAIREARRGEIVVFVFLALVLAPLLATLLVGGYGLLVWIWQMVHGPPGPPPP